jgi:hypothetical protein
VPVVQDALEEDEAAVRREDGSRARAEMDERAVREVQDVDPGGEPDKGDARLIGGEPGPEEAVLGPGEPALRRLSTSGEEVDVVVARHDAEA